MQKKKINNTFFDFLALIYSIFLNFFRSLFTLFSKKERFKKGNTFFEFLDFVFRTWPKYFWKKPTFYKFTNFFADILNFLFKK